MVKGTPGVSMKHIHHLISFLEAQRVIKEWFWFSGITIHCPGSPGHGSRFVENTAAEKLVSVSAAGVDQYSSEIWDVFLILLW